MDEEFLRRIGPGAPPTAYAGILYVPLAGELVALDESNGQTLWTVTLDGGVVSAPAVTDDGVFVSADCDSIYAVDPKTGAQLWHVGPLCDGGEAPIPSVFQGRVYLQTNSGPMILDARTGANVGTFTSVDLPAFYGTRGFFNERTPLYGVDLPGDKNVWSFSGDGSLNLTPIVVGGTVGATVYVQSDSGKLFGLDADSGALVWSPRRPATSAPRAHSLTTGSRSRSGEASVCRRRKLSRTPRYVTSRRPI